MAVGGGGDDGGCGLLHDGHHGGPGDDDYYDGDGSFDDVDIHFLVSWAMRGTRKVHMMFPDGKNGLYNKNHYDVPLGDWNRVSRVGHKVDTEMVVNG